MAETPPIHSPARTQIQPGPGLDSTQYWCYHCDNRVAVETLPDLPDIVCRDCKNGFVESISAAPAPSDDPALGNQFIEVLRLIAQAAREDDDPPPPIPSDPSDDDYLRIEPNAWGNDDEDDEDRSVVVVHEDATDTNQGRHNRSDGEDEDEYEYQNENEIEVVDHRGQGEEDEEDEEEEEEMRRRRRDELRLRLRDLATRAVSRRNRILDWAEILMGIEDHSIEMRLQVPESDTYVGNPGDYVDAAEYEALLQNLAEGDSGGRRGAPPASKGSVEGLETVVILKEEDVMGCAICKDVVSVGETATNLPCGHGYHGGCIVLWLGSRNSCPVCRFELPTDDPDYEEERKKRVVVAGLREAPSSSGLG